LRRRSGGVLPPDCDAAATLRPVAVDLANHQLRAALRPKAPLEAAVAGNVELAVVERRLTFRHALVGVLATK
jgi:hypothetical protein